MSHKGLPHHTATPGEHAAFVAILGTIFLGWAAWKIWRGFTTIGWSEVPGQVTDAFVSEDETIVDDRSSVRHGQRKILSLPRVLYAYSWNGRKHEGDCLQEGLLRVPRFLAAAQIAKYEAGQQVTVYVSPQDPSRAVLKRGPPIQAFALLAWALLLLWFAYALYTSG